MPTPTQVIPHRSCIPGIPCRWFHQCLLSSSNLLKGGLISLCIFISFPSLVNLGSFLSPSNQINFLNLQASPLPPEQTVPQLNGNSYATQPTGLCLPKICSAEIQRPLCDSLGQIGFSVFAPTANGTHMMFWEYSTVVLK